LDDQSAVIVVGMDLGKPRRRK